MKALYPNGDAIFVQDGASTHTSNIWQDYLRKALCRDAWVNKEQWPPKSPDLNLLDYHHWNVIKKRYMKAAQLHNSGGESSTFGTAQSTWSICKKLSPSSVSDYWP